MKEILFKGIEIAVELQDKIMANAQDIVTERDKQATINANKILDNVGTIISTKYGIERDITKFPKITDYLPFAVEKIGEQSLKKAEKVLLEKDNAIKALTEKLNAGFGDDLTKKEIENYKTIIAKLNTDIELTTKEKEEILKTKDLELSTFKQEIAVKNSIPIEYEKNIDEYRIKGKKEEATKKLYSEYNLITNENSELVAQKKDTLQIIKLDDFFKTELKDLLPKTQSGGGANPPSGTKLNYTSDSKTNAELIESHLLATKYKSKIEKGFSEDFNKMMLEANPKK